MRKVIENTICKKIHNAFSFKLLKKISKFAKVKYNYNYIRTI